jgi:hypothetical protein
MRTGKYKAEEVLEASNPTYEAAFPELEPKFDTAATRPSQAITTEYCPFGIDKLPM